MNNEPNVGMQLVPDENATFPIERVRVLMSRKTAEVQAGIHGVSVEELTRDGRIMIVDELPKQGLKSDLFVIDDELPPAGTLPTMKPKHAQPFWTKNWRKRK